MKTYRGNIVDPVSEQIFRGEILVDNGKILKRVIKENTEDVFILPGFIDSHVHIESAMLTPQNFSRLAVKHGTVATVSDPHEIANVLGEDGIHYMIENGKQADLKFFFGVPSCVPATGFETSGARIDSKKVQELLEKEDLYYLSEMMNYPGVVYNDPEVHAKIWSAIDLGKKIDGHAPGLVGEELRQYVEAGISTDHECYSYEEALEKIKLGMKIQIREGSAAKNFESLYHLIDEFPDRVMLCSDDLHPDDLLKGHVNILFKRALEKKIAFFRALKALTVNPVNHYNLNVGLLRENDPADFVIVDNLEELNVLKTIIDGKEVYDVNEGLKDPKPQKLVNRWYDNEIKPSDLEVKAEKGKIRVIEVVDGELITRERVENANIIENKVQSDIQKDILKIIVQNRYEKEQPAIAFIHGFGLKKGGLVSSIAHDSHNIISIGTDDNIISELVNWTNDNRGGVAVHNGKRIIGLPLPIAGIISDLKAEEVAKIYSELDSEVKKLGCTLTAPFMTLSFMALLVIPELKISNRGLFDGNIFNYTTLFTD